MNLPEAFQRYGTTALAETPGLTHSWSVEAGACTLSIPASSSCGFDIQCSVEQHVIILNWGNWHTPLDLGPDVDQLVEEMFDLLRDMLSPDMRIRELCVGSEPYRGFLESFDGTSWATEHEMGLIFWNYFGKRSEKIYTNSTLPTRTPKTVQGAAPDQ